MSRSRQIRVLSVVCFFLFFYIFWTGISLFLLGKTSADYRLFIVGLAMIFLMLFMMHKEMAKAVVISVPAILSCPLIFVIYKEVTALTGTVFILITLILFNKMEEEEINYDNYKGRIQTAFYIIMIPGALLPMINEELSKSLFRFYLLFFLCAILLLREARRFSLKIKGKGSYIANLGVAIFVLLLAVDKVFFAFLEVAKLILRIVNAGLEVIVAGISYVMQKPIQLLVDWLKSLLGKMDAEKLNKLMGETKVQNNTQVNMVHHNGLTIPVWVNSTLKIMILAVIVYAVYTVFLRYFSRETNLNSKEEELREAITRDKKKEVKKKEHKGFFERVFGGKHSLREEVYYIYRKFQKRTKEKGIYKEYMTATQLRNITAGFVKDDRPLDAMTLIYNESKFSNHEILKDQAAAIRDGYEAVKKEL